MYNWKQFSSLPGIKDLDLREQWQRWYRYQTFEAAATSPSSAASAAAGAGGGGSLPKRTKGRGAFFIDDYDTNFKFFLTDENGKKTDRIDTGIDGSDFYGYTQYSIDGKGYVVVYYNDDVYKFQYITAEGRIVRTDTFEYNPLKEGFENLWGGSFFYIRHNNDSDGFRTITYFDGENVYDVVFGEANEYSTADVDYVYNAYNYEATSWDGSNDSFEQKSSGAGLIVFDDLDGATEYKAYSLYKGQKVLINEELTGYNYDYTWDAKCAFAVVTTWNESNSEYEGSRIVDLKTGETITNFGVAENGCQAYDLTFYGRSKFLVIFSNASLYYMFLYDGVTGNTADYTHSASGWYYDFFCTQVTEVFGYNDNRNFISDDIVITFRSVAANLNSPFWYPVNFDLLYIPSGVFDGSQSENLVELTGKGLDWNSGMFTSKLFTMPADCTGVHNSQGTMGQLVIDAEGHNFLPLSFSVNDFDSYDLYQLYDSYVYKFFFSDDRDEIHIFGPEAQDYTGEDGFRLSPSNSFTERRELFIVNNSDDDYTYYFNTTTRGLSPSIVSLVGPDTLNRYYDDDSWTTYYNNYDNIENGIRLLSGNNYDETDNFVLLTGTKAPVYYDFSYIYGLNHNIYVGKTFIVVQYREAGIGYAKVYDHDGNLTQDLSFGECQWISSDDFVGDMGVIRFTGYDKSKRVFITKNKYHEYVLDWGYDHQTIFNDYRWFFDNYINV